MLDCGIDPCAPPAEQTDLQTVGSRSDSSGPPSNGPGWTDHDMLAEDDYWLREVLEETIIDHRLSAFRGFLPRLKDRHQCSMPSLAGLGKQRGRARKPGDVHVVTTHVAHRHGMAFTVLGFNFAGIWQTRRFLNRESIHVGPQHDCRTFAISQQADDTSLSYALRHLVAGGAKSFRRQTGSPRLLHR
jgi:hypothetical protein